MAVSTINSDVFINGSLASTSMTLSAGSVADATVSANAEIDSDMLIAEFITPATVAALHGPWCWAEIDESAG